MDSNLVNYFTPLESKEYKDVIRFLSENNIDVTFKVYDIHSKSSFVKVDGAELAIFKKYQYDYETTNIYCTFLNDGEPHFFRAKMSTSDNYYLVKFPEKIYKIQRRSNFRVDVPAKLKHELKLLDYPKLSAQIRDISLGGCKIAINTTEAIEDLKLEKDIRIWVQLLDFSGVTIDATIAFSKFIPEANNQLLGLKFSNMKNDEISTLHKTLIQVDRIARKGESD